MVEDIYPVFTDQFLKIQYASDLIFPPYPSEEIEILWIGNGAHPIKEELLWDIHPIFFIKLEVHLKDIAGLHISPCGDQLCDAGEGGLDLLRQISPGLEQGISDPSFNIKFFFTPQDLLCQNRLNQLGRSLIGCSQSDDFSDLRADGAIDIPASFCQEKSGDSRIERGDHKSSHGMSDEIYLLIAVSPAERFDKIPELQRGAQIAFPPIVAEEIDPSISKLSAIAEPVDQSLGGVLCPILSAVFLHTPLSIDYFSVILVFTGPHREGV